ncbi:hypothetical protein OH77DRAFT_537859 [Trametes cingulata]|nr:hypothetical protein OH77DRAFT_537859 [Trametes cingulata]
MLSTWRIAAVVKATEDPPVASVQYDIHLWPDQKEIHDPWRLPHRSCHQISSSSPETKLQRPQSVRSAPGPVPSRAQRASQNKKREPSDCLPPGTCSCSNRHLHPRVRLVLRVLVFPNLRHTHHTSGRLRLALACSPLFDLPRNSRRPGITQ